MGKSRQGGVFGYLRGKVGSVSYSVQKGENSSSGKTEQVVRALPESVKNPQTASQTMQRMKLAPAQKFYNAFAQLLSNAFEGVAYGNASRQYFMSLAMSQNGPYVQKGVDRFLPANYPFSRGSLPTVAISPFTGGTTVIKLEAITEAANPTNADLANALGVPVDTQITIAVVNNINGVFVPSHIGYNDRLTIEQLPEGFVTNDSNKLVLNPALLGLDMSAMVACCVVLSRQDASGAWLRSTQDMVISQEMYAALYSPDALTVALASYQDTKSANSINNSWYYNLGLNQAFNGQVTMLSVDLDGVPVSLLVGVQQQNGVVKYTIFATSTDGDGDVVGVIGQTATTELDNGATYKVSEVLEAYPAFGVALYTPAIAQQAGKDDGVLPAQVMLATSGGFTFPVTRDGKLITGNNLPFEWGESYASSCPECLLFSEERWNAFGVEDPADTGISVAMLNALKAWDDEHGRYVMSAADARIVPGESILIVNGQRWVLMTYDNEWTPNTPGEYNPQ